MRFSILILFLFVHFFEAIAQEMVANDNNFRTITPITYDITPELKKLTPIEFQDHPEFGILPFNAPCQNCYELIHKRTDTTRIFVEKGSEGTYFYSQASKGAIHYKDVDGNYLTYDHRIKETVANSEIFKANKQGTPLEISIAEKNTKLYLADGNIFVFNNSLTLIHQSDLGNVSSLGTADWTHYTAGDDGVKIIDAWPGIDIELKLALGELKTNYIIKSNLGFTDGFLIFKDDFILPENYQADFDLGFEIDPLSGKKIGNISIISQDGIAVTINTSFGFDQSGVKENSTRFGYDLTHDNLAIWVPVEWTNAPGMVYPLTIDPLVTSSATYTVGMMNFRFSGSWCGGPNPDCQYTLNVPRPANSTLTGATFSLVQQTLVGTCFWSCWMSEAGFYFSTPCGLNGYYNCNVANPGTCTATNLNISNLVTCLGPACSGSVNFTIFNSYCYCMVGGCGTSCQRINNNTWIVTLTGTTIETLGNTTTGNGSITINDPTCSGTSILNPTPANGVPGYTYVWSTGATTPTISVVNTPAVYTATVTDACGTSVIATFNIGCPLPIRLNYFDAALKNEKVNIEWETLSEINSDYFIVQRADKSGQFYDLFKVDANENSSEVIFYNAIDENPMKGISYYRLVLVDIDGLQEFSDIKSVVFNEDDVELYIVPNPNNGVFELFYTSEISNEAKIEIYTTGGQILKSENFSLKIGDQIIPLDYRDLPKGVYILKFYSNNKVITEKLVVN